MQDRKSEETPVTAALRICMAVCVPAALSVVSPYLAAESLPPISSSQAFITDIQPAGCLRPGMAILIRGPDLGSGTNSQLLIINGPDRIGLPVQSWERQAIRARIPELAWVPGVEESRARMEIIRMPSGRPEVFRRDVTLCAAQGRQRGLSSGHSAPAPAHSPDRWDSTAQPRYETPRRTGRSPVGENASAVRPDSSGRSTNSSSSAAGGRIASDQGRQAPESGTSSAGEASSTITPEGSSAFGQPAMGSMTRPQLYAGQDFEPGEILIMHADMKSAAEYDTRISELGGRLLRRRVLRTIDVVLSAYRVPEGKEVETLQALSAGPENLLALDLNVFFDPHFGRTWETQESVIEFLGGTADHGCGAGLRLGMLDTGVNTLHPALHGQSVSTRSFLAAGRVEADQTHGTGVATLLVARSLPEERFRGLVPGAALYAGGVFENRNGRTKATSENLLVGLDWLVGEGVSVINLSLGGAHNSLLELSIRKIIEEGIQIVASARLNKKTGQAYFPASMQGVIAVNAVDIKGRLTKDSPVGNYISFAAPGVDIWVGTADGAGIYQTGSSFAAPYVSAALLLAGKDSLPRLQQTALDIGPVGKDDRYGYGLVRLPSQCISGN